MRRPSRPRSRNSRARIRPVRCCAASTSVGSRASVGSIGTTSRARTRSEVRASHGSRRSTPSSTRPLTNSSQSARAHADALGAEMQELLPAIGALIEGRLLHGDLARMHILVEPEHGNLTGVIDWGDLQVGDPAWDLAIARCHFASPSEGILRVHHSRYANLFPHLVDGYCSEPVVTERMSVLGDFYLAYRQAWVAKLGPGEGGVPNPSLAMLLQRLASNTATSAQD